MENSLKVQLSLQTNEVVFHYTNTNFAIILSEYLKDKTSCHV